MEYKYKIINKNKNIIDKSSWCKLKSWKRHKLKNKPFLKNQLLIKRSIENGSQLF
jgi:hypothetical protein